MKVLIRYHFRKLYTIYTCFRHTGSFSLHPDLPSYFEIYLPVGIISRHVNDDVLRTYWNRPWFALLLLVVAVIFLRLDNCSDVAL